MLLVIKTRGKYYMADFYLTIPNEYVYIMSIVFLTKSLISVIIFLTKYLIYSFVSELLYQSRLKTSAYLKLQ